jgi:hypothetical protein
MKSYTLQWYRRYADIVLSALQHPRFQRFLTWLLRREHIPVQHIKAIQVRLLPRIKANGCPLKGAATSHGIITLYPHTIPTNSQVNARADAFFLKYVQWRARATLIHELLHYKYRHREQRVRQLTQQYTQRCMQPTTSAMQRVFMRIFRTPSHHSEGKCIAK